MTPVERFDRPAPPHDEWLGLAAAYAIDALDPAEKQAVESHLAGCAQCRAELASMEPVAAGLGALAPPEVPPGSLKSRTLARAIGQTRAAPPPAAGPMARRAAPPPSWWLLAASAALAIGFAIYAWSLRSQIDSLQQSLTAMAANAQDLRVQLANARRDSVRMLRVVDVLDAPDAVRVDLKGQADAAAASGRAVWSRSRGLYVSVDRLPALAPGRVYQVWVLAPGPVSAGILTMNATGQGMFSSTLPAGVSPVGAVAITREPGPSGSPTPTMPILLVGQIKTTN